MQKSLILLQRSRLCTVETFRSFGAALARLSKSYRGSKYASTSPVHPLSSLAQLRVALHLLDNRGRPSKVPLLLIRLSATGQIDEVREQR
jgi:hypothetical protein